MTHEQDNLLEKAEKFMDTKFSGHGYSITIHDWRNDCHYGYNVSSLLSEFAAEVSEEKDKRIAELEAALEETKDAVKYWIKCYENK